MSQFIVGGLLLLAVFGFPIMALNKVYKLEERVDELENKIKKLEEGAK
ncbi:hypothetical protein [Bacillus pinisoli]|nr:hypothetical protein [Bacillus pinisoli]